MAEEYKTDTISMISYCKAPIEYAASQVCTVRYYNKLKYVAEYIGLEIESGVGGFLIFEIDLGGKRKLIFDAVSLHEIGIFLTGYLQNFDA